MSLFDRIVVNREVYLPLPEEIKNTINTYYIYSQEFQTKSLERSMSTYDINADMSITRNYRQGEFTEKRPLPTPQKIDFYVLIQDDRLDNDYWIEWTFVYTDDVKDITLKKFKITPNSVRKQQTIDFFKLMVESDE